MPKGIRKEYSPEIKLAAVMLMKSKAMRPKEVFEILGGIDRQTVYRWIKEYENGGEAAFRRDSAVLPGKTPSNCLKGTRRAFWQTRRQSPSYMLPMIQGTGIISISSCI